MTLMRLIYTDCKEIRLLKLRLCHLCAITFKLFL